MQTNAAHQTPDDFIAAGHTPMMAQYMAVKAAHPDCLLLYRMGDFYELFFDDALTASRILDITLTRRGKTQGDEIPMCGVPVHALDPYLARLIKAGHRVAICEQTETPVEAKKRGGAKALVTRDVIRIVTPATLTEDTLLNARAANYLAALTSARGELGLAWLDLSTGLVHTEAIAPAALPATLARLNPAELLVNQRVMEDEALRQTIEPLGRAVTVQGASLFDAMNAQTRLLGYYKVGTLDAFGRFSAGEIAALGALIDYVERTQKSQVTHLRPPVQINSTAIMAIDPATRRNLELTETMAGTRDGSLLATIDRTVTAAGARLLHARISAPLCDRAAIAIRHDEIDALLEPTAPRAQLRDALAVIPDLERALSRLALGRGSPRDLAAVRDTITGARNIHALFADAPDALQHLLTPLGSNQTIDSVRDELASALADDLPALTSDGGFIRAGYHADLDHTRGLRDNGRRMIIALQQQYANVSGVDTLKIAHNNILGYYIEVSAKKADALFAKPDTFIHRQTMVNAVRFTTTELAGLERDLVAAADRALAIELDLFATLRDQILAVRAPLIDMAGSIAALDVAASLADLAASDNYVRPILTDDDAFHIAGGRHPVVEAALKFRGVPFIANDASVCGGQNLWLLTGPNMAGKSTFLRQNAVIIILAQMGAFVPATSATIGMVDKLFSRVGAADDLAQGRSTFMVEMVETAAILHQATARSFVILDEIGRGTATFDGLSIAWATLEFLHDVIKCRALFATHYHELTTLQSRLPHLYAATMDVKEWQGDIVFLHSVRPGNADRSYGIHVAKLAGLPSAVTTRAATILHTLETGEQGAAVAQLAEDLPLFTHHTPVVPVMTTPHPVIEHLKTLDIDTLSPRDALDILYQLKTKI